MSVLFNPSLPDGCRAFGQGASEVNVQKWMNILSATNSKTFSLLLLLAGTRTAECKGISSAGATSQSRKYTALADAELFLYGPRGKRKFSLPPLKAGVSPALISYVARQWIAVEPSVLAVGLYQQPSFPCLVVEPHDLGPSACITTGKAMDISRVNALWERGKEIGMELKGPLILAECVPGGTTTAQAVLTGLGISVADLISGSSRNPPIALKTRVVTEALRAGACGDSTSPKNLVAAIGDPFQPLAVGILLGALEVCQPVLLGGGSQMMAVLALALASLPYDLRQKLVKLVVIGTTAWLVDETIKLKTGVSSLELLMNRISDHFHVSLLGIATGLHFYSSAHQALRDYEIGFIKEGVGAGALALLAQLGGASLQDLVDACDKAFLELRQSPEHLI